MCRFLIVKSENKFDPGSLLADFAEMCEKSRTMDGDRQVDGFGVAWMENGTWRNTKSLQPIWQEKDILKEVPETDLLVGHARSATFKNKIGKTEYNQPYINSMDAFVFNGHLKGVSLQVDGEVGAQKIWNLINKFSRGKITEQTLKQFYAVVSDSTKQIVGMNIGVVAKEDIFILSDDSNQDGYFDIKIAEEDDKLIICSEEIGEYKFEKLSRGEVLHYN